MHGVHAAKFGLLQLRFFVSPVLLYRRRRPRGPTKRPAPNYPPSDRTYRVGACQIFGHALRNTTKFDCRERSVLHSSIRARHMTARPAPICRSGACKNIWEPLVLGIEDVKVYRHLTGGYKKKSVAARWRVNCLSASCTIRSTDSCVERNTETRDRRELWSVDGFYNLASAAEAASAELSKSTQWTCLSDPGLQHSICWKVNCWSHSCFQFHMRWQQSVSAQVLRMQLLYCFNAIDKIALRLSCARVVSHQLYCFSGIVKMHMSLIL